ncbi:hypothetical protein GCM10017608_35730 [Agromyces luteolus]|uniref:HNH nuclease domain-containing protein n=1 Tax=Agromyces luteolus TaxID=88373 RepID=A0A7C9HK32_9MICO|nr:HNH endonuclease signature motif containing protein [Agromyces luteolus]MUN06864.1 hypothetical protein [Agromyces luteolus]GLK29635.1 hypothetical protein GCM10017608_35730 [Agromyces luteolus]
MSGLTPDQHQRITAWVEWADPLSATNRILHEQTRIPSSGELTIVIADEVGDALTRALVNGTLALDGPNAEQQMAAARDLLVEDLIETVRETILIPTEEERGIIDAWLRWMDAEGAVRARLGVARIRAARRGLVGLGVEYLELYVREAFTTLQIDMTAQRFTQRDVIQHRDEALAAFVKKLDGLLPGELPRPGRNALGWRPPALGVRPVGAAWQDARMRVVARDGLRCRICGTDVFVTSGPHPQRLHIDHVVPLANGGAPLDVDNLRVTCQSCNLAKGSR